MQNIQISKKLQTIIKKVQKQLVEASDPKYQQIQYKYFKEQVGIRGLRSKQIEGIFKDNWEEKKNNFSYLESVQLGMELFKDPHLEDRCVGMRIFNGIHKDFQNIHIDQIQNLILQGFVKDWGTIDTLCSRLLTPWSLLSKQNTNYIADWRFRQDNLWVRRASCVTFVNRAKNGDNEPNFQGFSDLMFEICKETVQYDERFNQLGSGWLMRGLTVSHRERAIKFIEDNYDQYSREGLRYAIEKLDNKERKRLLNYGKMQQQQNNSQEEEGSDSEESDKKRKPKKISQKKKGVTKKKY